MKASVTPNRDWIKKLVDTHEPWQIVETMNDLVDRAENAEDETNRVTRQIQAQSDAFALCANERGHLRRHLRNLAEAAEWYVRCLMDVNDGHFVRGLLEAQSTYHRAYSRAMRELED